MLSYTMAMMEKVVHIVLYTTAYRAGQGRKGGDSYTYCHTLES